MKRAGRYMVLLALATGCSSLRQGRNAPAPQAAGDTTVEQFVEKWNANAKDIDSVVCDYVDISGRSEGQPISLNARLAYQQPNGLRLLGRFASKDEFDLGSNDEEIWFWIARAKPPAVYFCKRAELDRVRIATPFQPDWVVEVLGVRPIDANQYKPDKSNSDYLSLVTTEQTPGGAPVIKRIVVDRQTNRIASFELFDARAKRLAQADILAYHDDPQSGMFVPKEVRLEWPETETTLKIKMAPRKVVFNSITPEWASSLFRRGEYINSEVINLVELAERDAEQFRRDQQVQQARALGSPRPMPADLGGGR